MKLHPSALRHVVVNGWFYGRLETGSGQYLHQLLEQMPGRAAADNPPGAPPIRWTLLVPAEDNAAAPGPSLPHVVVAPLPLPQVPGLPLAARKLWWEQVVVPRWAARLQADLLWVPYWAAPLLQPVATAVTVHDLIPLLLPGYREGILQRGYNWIVSSSARRADAVITVSHAAARDIVQYLAIRAERVHVVHHGPNQPPAASPLPDPLYLAAVRARYALPDRYFLYLGGFDARKNVGAILSAYARFLQMGGDPAVRLVVAGRLPVTDSPFAPDPRPVAAALGLGDKVHFPGWIDEADKPALYALSLGYLFPSLYEGFGMMVLEAQQAGAPVITSA
jgi:glycosyltransferase involved in cell wall biosynthesis